jgi:predicted oxidoreductase
MTTTIPLHKHGIKASRLVLGCMGFGGGWDSSSLTAEHFKQGQAAVEAALSAGINMFDHADIYTRGKAEQVFGQILKDRPDLRDHIIIQSKCGIRREEGPGFPGRFDFSKEHIRSSVDGILSRLGVEFIDILLLHRPDPLMEPEEVAEVFRDLKQSGKVKSFGVSNMSAAQIRFLQSAIESPILVNQMELSLLKLDWLDSVIHVNQERGTNVSFPEGTIEYCQMENIQIQAWSPLARGLFSGKELEGKSDSVKKTAALVQSMAEQKDTTPEAIVLAFLIRHPAGIQPVIGTVNPERILACGKAEQVHLTREEWYTLYITSRGFKLP